MRCRRRRAVSGETVVYNSDAYFYAHFREALACGFAQALLGEWHQMDLTARMALPPGNPARYVFLWVQRDEHGHRTGTQAGVSVWADGRGIQSGVGRVAPAYAPAARVSEDEATSAALEYLRELGLEVIAIRAELVLSWLPARDQGPVWLVYVTPQPGGSSKPGSVGLEQVSVVDAVTGAVLGWTGGALVVPRRPVVAALAAGLLCLALVALVYANWRRREVVAQTIGCPRSQVWCYWTSAVWCWVPQPPVRHFTIVDAGGDVKGIVILSRTGRVSLVSLDWSMVAIAQPPPDSIDRATEAARAVALRYWSVRDPRLVLVREVDCEGRRSFTFVAADAAGATFEIEFAVYNQDTRASLITRRVGGVR